MQHKDEWIELPPGWVQKFSGQPGRMGLPYYKNEGTGAKQWDPPARVPAAGFGSLMGFNGAQHRFELQRVEGGSARLPSAQTCFNTLRLPQYSSESELRQRLLLAISAAAGFEEDAVAQ